MSVDAAAAALRRGELVAFPTETVYGLGADASSDVALARLYAVKGRPADHPVIVHIASAARLDDVAHVDDPRVRDLVAECWPGPLTVVLHKRDDVVSRRATGGRSTVGVRVPDHPLALELLSELDFGVAAPSANRFGRVSPTTAEHVATDLGEDVAVILDGGPCAVGVESTIVDCTDPSNLRVLRVGGLAVAEIERIVGAPVGYATLGEVAAPGTLRSHYTPDARVVIVSADELVPTFGAYDPSRVGLIALAGVAQAVTRVTVLATPVTVDDYARDLYAAFRHADTLGLDVVFVVPPTGDGIAAAVRDRITRAAAQ
jgi:L-threonylcarbamoyladenylate synthase